MKFTPFFSLLLMITLYSCSSTNDVKQSFTDLCSAAENQAFDELPAMVTTGSLQYLNTIIESARTDNETEMLHLGHSSERPLMTMMLFQQLVNELRIDSTSLDGVEAPDLLSAFTFLGTGPFQPGLQLDDAMSTSSTTANLYVVVPTGGKVSILSTYQYELEDGRWKVDFPSTLEVPEKVLNQSFKKSGLGIRTYVTRYLNINPEEMEFRYRY
ncbi:hypothetical protein [Lewinella sp. 4G2]|uniref:hypothetical protein n=1 Tax=Lewinella sp. 4G2 TaxID=1803372 RepID=UPI0007B4F0C1|nr:hypothetical protein [Lewinella sp. 4G2]OAV43488.1 hypothetical protein A3850_002805 [Lewinella sp. 4G2]